MGLYPSTALPICHPDTCHHITYVAELCEKKTRQKLRPFFTCIHKLRLVFQIPPFCLPLRFQLQCMLLLYLYRARNKITQLSIPTHAQVKCQRLKFIKNHLKNSYMFRSTTIFRELQCPR